MTWVLSFITVLQSFFNDDDPHEQAGMSGSNGTRSRVLALVGSVSMRCFNDCRSLACGKHSLL